MSRFEALVDEIGLQEPTNGRLFPEHLRLVERPGNASSAAPLRRNLTQQELAKNAGVGIKALRRFESRGQGTPENVLRIAVALGVQDAFGALFEPPRFDSLAEAEAQAAVVTRRRARKRSGALDADRR